MSRKLLVMVGLMGLMVPLVNAKQGKGKGKGHEKGGATVAVGVFVESDRRVLHDYAVGYRGNLPPGLAKRDGDLPPGLQKQLVRKGHLPPGLEKRLVPFPVELERRMSPLEPGLQRGFIGGRAVIFNTSTRVIVDVLIPLE
jgi:hypothetical protein